MPSLRQNKHILPDHCISEQLWHLTRSRGPFTTRCLSLGALRTKDATVDENSPAANRTSRSVVTARAPAPGANPSGCCSNVCCWRSPPSSPARTFTAALSKMVSFTHICTQCVNQTATLLTLWSWHDTAAGEALRAPAISHPVPADRRRNRQYCAAE